MNWKDLEPKTNALRDSLTQIIEKIKANSAPNLPQPEPTLNLSLELLKKPSYDVVVCGEIKKGKSTFINAMIGREILPVDTQVATSQVFRISNSPTESFELAFIDGTRQRIEQHELSKYGSQVEINLKNETQFINSKVVDYIQVNVPVAFLPQGVTIVDTPGLGSLHADHEQITTRYIQNAAAVIFIFDPANPMVQQEKDFLEKIFAVTPYVMFVMTKRDCYLEDIVVTQIRRNEDLLKVFESKCYTTPQIFPVGSKVLSEAGEQDDEAIREMYYIDSQFPEIKEELQRLIYTTVGLSRNTYAFAEAGKRYKKVASFINEQIITVSESDVKEQEALKQKRKELGDWFNERWGAKSETRRKVQDKISELSSGIQNRGQEMASSNSKLYQKYQSEIDAIKVIAEAQRLSEELPGRIKNDISSKWKNLNDSSMDKIKEILVEFKSKMDEELDDKRGSVEISLSSGAALMKLSDRDKFDCFKGSYMSTTIGVGVGTYLLYAVGITLAPFALLIGIGTIIAGFWGGQEQAREKELKSAKAQLKTNLQTFFSQVRDWLLVKPMKGEGYSPVQKLQKEIRDIGDKMLTAVYETQLNEFKQEDKRLEEQLKMSAEQKQKEKINLQNQQKIWNSIGMNLRGAQTALENVMKSLKNKV